MKGFTMSQTLLGISDDMQAMDDLLYERGGVVTDDDLPVVEKWMKELEANFKDKADGYAALITIMRARADVRRAEAHRLMGRVKIDETGADWLQYRLKMVMEKLGIKKIETERYRISVAANGGKCPLVIYDEASLPGRFFIPSPDVIDRDAVRDALDAGEEVAGAKLGERGTSLRIK
jgi:hypothetical protein